MSIDYLRWLYFKYFLTLCDRLVLCGSAVDEEDGRLAVDRDSDRVVHWSECFDASMLAFRLLVRRPCCIFC